MNAEQGTRPIGRRLRTSVLRWHDQWSPWRLRARLARADEDVRRFGIHLYCCNVQRDWAESLLPQADREGLRRTWQENEATVVSKAHGRTR